MKVELTTTSSKTVIKEAVEKCYLSHPACANLSVTNILLNSLLGLGCHFQTPACTDHFFMPLPGVLLLAELTSLKG